MGATLTLKKILKVLRNVLIILFAIIVLVLIITFIVHRCLLAKEKKLLEEQGYINLVSAGDYDLNVYMYGNDNNPKHTIVGISGMGVQDYAVSLKGVTDNLSNENKIVIIDRAGYGWSDDTIKEQTVEQVVNDYRTALKNSGCKAPYILMPHSYGGTFATYWLNTYPEEIEAVIYLDTTDLGNINENPDAYDWEVEAGIFEYVEGIACKVGLQRIYYIFQDIKPWSSGISDNQIEYAKAFSYKNVFSLAQCSEYNIYKNNIQTAYNSIKTNDIPKLYITALLYEKEDVIEYYKYANKIMSSFGMSAPYNPNDNDTMERITEIYKENSALTYEILTKPYMDKLGNCTYLNIPGDHFIFIHKPQEVTKACQEFLATLD